MGGRAPIVLATALALCIGAVPAGAQTPAQAAAATAQLNRDGRALSAQRNFPASMAKFIAAVSAADAIPEPTLRLYYQVSGQVGIATDLTAMQRFQEALLRADWVNQIASDTHHPLPKPMKAAIHHVRGAILFNLGRQDEARAMFRLAGREGDRTAAAWLRAIAVAWGDAAQSGDVAATLASADAAAQSGDAAGALALYASALRRPEALGSNFRSAVERTITVAVRLQPRPAVPPDAAQRADAADAALRAGTPAGLRRVRGDLRDVILRAPWWADGWLRLAAIDERLGVFAVARGELGLYLRAAPEAPDRAAVERRIAELTQRIGR